jgi:aspartate/tyrosine/aromatic aminotransferase
MMGDDKNPGIIPMMNQDLFARVAAGVADGRKFLVIVSYLEIYNEARTATVQTCGCTGALDVS